MPIERGLIIAVLLAGTAAAWGHGDAGVFAGGAEHHEEAAVTAAGPSSAPPADETVRSDSPLIVVDQVQTRSLIERRAGIGRVIAGAGAVHTINAFISGQLGELLVQPGMRVRRGDPVARVESPEFIRTQKAYLALLSNDQKLEILSGEGRLSNYVADARENLRWWGMDDQQIKRLEDSGETVDSITIRSSVSGVVTEVLAQPGDLINAGDRAMAQFVVMGRAIARVLADQQPLWLEGFLFPDQLAGVRPEAARVALQLPGGRTFQRPLHSVTPMVGERQLGRIMVPLGIDSAPAGGSASGEQGVPAQPPLYPGQPVRFELLIERSEPLWVPRAALLGQGLATVVFVQQEPGVFERRAVDPGTAVGDWVAVTGLPSDSEVVVQGKMALEGAYRLSAAQSVADGDDHHH